MRILTWHVHGHYLLYLTQGGHEYYLPVKDGRPPGYGGRAGFPWGKNVHEVPASEVKRLDLDCIVFQSRRNFLEDQCEILSSDQMRLPRIYIEHEPPHGELDDARHIVDDPSVLLVHVTAFNDLMWNSGRTPTRVIDHGVMLPPNVQYRGDKARGIVVINHLGTRGRRLGGDVFEKARRRVPLDLVGIEAEKLGGLGEIPPPDLPDFASHYRFLFSPIRHASLSLAICEAMMIGIPIVGLATTELVTVIENGVSGYIDTSLEKLIPRMEMLLADAELARRLGEGARRRAMERFGIDRFIRDWDDVFACVTNSSMARPGRHRPGKDRAGALQ